MKLSRFFMPLPGSLVALRMIFSKVPLRDRERLHRMPPIFTMPGTGRVLARDRRFFIYEIGFILYGTAFMALITAKPMWTVDKEWLALDWRFLLGAKGLSSVMMFILTPYFGKKLDRIGPGWLAGFSYSGLALYAVLLGFSSSPLSFLIAEMVFGCSMAEPSSPGMWGPFLRFR